MKKYFITGTDTDIGKTLVSSILTRALQGNYWKPISAGSSDIDTIKQLTELPDAHFFPSSYQLKAHLSPDQAAAREDLTLNLDQCTLPETSRSLIVEGAGGVFVPINKEHCMLDLMKQLDLPVVIVTRGTLGTINHTLLTITTWRQWGLKIHGVIFNGELNPDNQAAIESWGKVKTLLHVPHFSVVNSDTLKHWIASQRENILEHFT